MKVRLSYGLLLLLPATFFACKKESPFVLNETAELYLNATLNGISYRVEAGAQHYLYTTYGADSNGVIFYEGKLQDDSLGTANSWVLRFRAHRPGAVIHTDSALHGGHYPLSSQDRLVPSDHLVRVNFEPQTGSSVFQYFWSFENGSSFSYLENPEIVLDLNQPDATPVSLTVLHSSGCSSNATHYVDVTNNTCKGSFSCASSGFNFTCYANALTGTLQQVDWYVDSVYTGSGQTITFGTPGSGLHEVRAMMTFSGGCTYEMARNLLIYSSGGYAGEACPIDFDYSFAPEMIPDDFQLGTVEMVYTDDQGKEFSSFLGSGTDSLEVLSVSPYELNHLGQSTRKIHLRFSAELKAADGSVMSVQNAEGRWAVAIPSAR